jgi:hypothetical protein
MNKQRCLGLVFTLITILLLTGTAFADGSYVDKDGSCWLRWLAYDRKGDVVERASVKGDFMVVRNNTKIATTCSGIVPLGEEYFYKNHIETRFTLEQTCAYFGECEDENMFILSYGNYPAEAPITDPLTGETYYTQDWILKVNSTGRFHLDKVYIFP